MRWFTERQVTASIMHHTRIAFILSLCIAVVYAAGCGFGGNEPRQPERVPVTEVRPAPQDLTEVPERSTRERMGMEAPTAAAARDAEAAADTGPSLLHDTPEGWTAAPASRMRVLNFQVADAERAECFVTILPGEAGGLLANLNRWLRQVGQAPLEEDDLADLQQLALLGATGYVVEVGGTFTGMRGDLDLADYALRGVAALGNGETYFVKMTGPAEVVAANREKFDQFVTSLRRPGEAAAERVASAASPETVTPEAPPSLEEAPLAPGADADAADAPAPDTALPDVPIPDFDPSRLEWQAPGDWTQAADRPMRVVTYTFGPENAGEIYITALRGQAGGIRANLNRWRNQMGQDFYTEEAFAALPRLEVLGQEVPLLDASGTFTGMTGGNNPGFRMLGVAVPIEGYTLFIKMVGPAEAVAAQTDAFRSFCDSLRTAQ